nr:MAG TPA: hypothetical protein [Caudoviricetes sp.]DAW63053.1 MAG TPA: hypothetical protein [Caudoviricetes sp.]
MIYRAKKYCLTEYYKAPITLLPLKSLVPSPLFPSLQWYFLRP